MVATIAAPEVGSWAEAVEQESQSTRGLNEDGVRTVVSHITENGQKYKVVSQFQVLTKKVPRVVAERKKWKKFGACEQDPPGPNIATTLVADEVDLQFTRNNIGEQILDVQEEKVFVKSENQMHCRYCKQSDHWSTTCPYKDLMMTEEETQEGDADGRLGMGMGRETGGTVGGRYIPPNRVGGMDRPGDRRSDENTCRVTNLPQDMDESELREIFTSIGKCTRVFIARDKMTSLPKGFAFVTYEHREDAARAIVQLNNYKVHHMVLKVEWTRPSNDK